MMMMIIIILLNMLVKYIWVHFLFEFGELLITNWMLMHYRNKLITDSLVHSHVNHTHSVGTSKL